MPAKGSARPTFTNRSVSWSILIHSFRQERTSENRSNTGSCFIRHRTADDGDACDSRMVLAPACGLPGQGRSLARAASDHRRTWPEWKRPLDAVRERQ